MSEDKGILSSGLSKGLIAIISGVVIFLAYFFWGFLTGGGLVKEMGGLDEQALLDLRNEELAVLSTRIDGVENRLHEIETFRAQLDTVEGAMGLHESLVTLLSDEELLSSPQKDHLAIHNSVIQDMEERLLLRLRLCIDELQVTFCLDRATCPETRPDVVASSGTGDLHKYTSWNSTFSRQVVGERDWILKATAKYIGGNLYDDEDGRIPDDEAQAVSFGVDTDPRFIEINHDRPGAASQGFETFRINFAHIDGNRYPPQPACLPYKGPSE